MGMEKRFWFRREQEVVGHQGEGEGEEEEEGRVESSKRIIEDME